MSEREASNKFKPPKNQHRPQGLLVYVKILETRLLKTLPTFVFELSLNVLQQALPQKTQTKVTQTQVI